MTTSRDTPDKPALTIEAQIERLRGRGMVIADEDHACQCLAHFNYYRLSGYWKRFETRESGRENGELHFQDGTTFDAVIKLYDFDRRLRLEVNDALEFTEVSLRTRWAYALGLREGCNAHRKAELFNESHKEPIKKLETLYNQERNMPFYLSTSTTIKSHQYGRFVRYCPSASCPSG